MVNMDDLISRQALKEAMYIEAMVKDSDEQKWDSGCWIRYKMFERVVNSLPSAKPKWIPVTERLPEKYIGEWLCCTDEGEIMVLPYDTPGDGSKECVFYEWDDNGYYYQTFNVVAWMPLPEPWKGEKE